MSAFAEIHPGAIRIRATSAGGVVATGVDCVVEVQNADGSWTELELVTSVKITIEPSNIVAAVIGVLVTELDITAPKESVTRTTVPAFADDDAVVGSA